MLNAPRPAAARIPPGRSRRSRSIPSHSAEAKQKFDELMKSLQEQMLKPFMQGMQQGLQNLTPEDLQRMREMMRDLNRMLRERAAGGRAGLPGLQGQVGAEFPRRREPRPAARADGQADGPDAVADAEPHAGPAAGAPGDDAVALHAGRAARGRDGPARHEPRAAHAHGCAPPTLRLQGRREPLACRKPCASWKSCSRWTSSSASCRRARDPGDLDKIDPAEVERLLGEEAARELERLRELAKKLEEAGYLEQQGGQLELTARAIRKIGDKALRDVFAHLKRDRFGRHAVSRRGAGGDRTDDAKRYEFGDPVPARPASSTLMNAVERRGPGTPVRLVAGRLRGLAHRAARPRSATVVLLDLSRSMLYNGCFLPAKKVALALHALIRGQFPRDSLHIVGFSLYAREFSADGAAASSPPARPISAPTCTRPSCSRARSSAGRRAATSRSS